MIRRRFLIEALTCLKCIYIYLKALIELGKRDKCEAC